MSRVEITVLSDLAKMSVVDLTVQNLRLQERWFRAGKRAAMFFLAAGFSIFIPAMHFFLVPSFLLLSAYSLVSLSQLQNSFVPGDFDCPACGKKNATPAKSFNWPLRIDCAHCGAQLKAKLLMT